MNVPSFATPFIAQGSEYNYKMVAKGKDGTVYKGKILHYYSNNKFTENKKYDLYGLTGHYVCYDVKNNEWSYGNNLSIQGKNYNCTIFESQEEFDLYEQNEYIEEYLENNPEFLDMLIEAKGLADTIPLLLPSGRLSLLNSSLDNLKSLVKDSLKTKIDEFLTGAVDWLGQKLEKLSSSLYLGAQLVDEAGAYLKLYITTMFNDTESQEYIEDISNGLDDDFSECKQLDIYAERVENTNDYNVYIFDHETFENVGYIYTSAKFDNNKGSYYIDYDIVGESLPDYRGIYRYESHGVTWDSPNTNWHENIGIKYNKGITDTGFYVIGKKSEVEKATGQEYPDVPDDPEEPEEPEGNYSGFLATIIELLEDILLQLEETKDDILLYLEEIKDEIQNLFISSKDENGNPVGFLGILDHLSGITANIFDFLGTGVGGVGEVISEAVGEAIGNTVGNITIPTGFLLGLPKFILSIGGVLVSLVGIMLKFVVFITTLWNVEPTSELLSEEMIESINYVRYMDIPVFGNLYMLTISLITVLAGFMIIKIIRRYEVNG